MVEIFYSLILENVGQGEVGPVKDVLELYAEACTNLFIRHFLLRAVVSFLNLHFMICNLCSQVLQYPFTDRKGKVHKITKETH